MCRFENTHADLYDLKQTNKRDNKVGVIGGLLLLAMYIAVSTMEYNDCLRGAISC